MASAVDICNLALAHLGDRANLSSLAEHCTRFYPVARDSLLEMHAWNFATRRAQLALLAEDIDTAWTYAYAAPTAVLTYAAVLAEGAKDEDGQPFVVETLSTGLAVVYTDVENAVLLYVARVTDTTKFSPLFVDALSWLLASYLAGPVIKGDSGVAAGDKCFKTFQGQFARAAGSDANQRRASSDYVPASIAARGGIPLLADGRIIR